MCACPRIEGGARARGGRRKAQGAWVIRPRVENVEHRGWFTQVWDVKGEDGWGLHSRCTYPWGMAEAALPWLAMGQGSSAHMAEAALALAG